MRNVHKTHAYASRQPIFHDRILVKYLITVILRACETTGACILDTLSSLASHAGSRRGRFRHETINLTLPAVCLSSLPSSFSFIAVEHSSKMAGFVLGTGSGILASAAVYYTLSTSLHRETADLQNQYVNLSPTTWPRFNFDLLLRADCSDMLTK